MNAVYRLRCFLAASFSKAQHRVQSCCFCFNSSREHSTVRGYLTGPTIRNLRGAVAKKNDRALWLLSPINFDPVVIGDETVRITLLTLHPPHNPALQICLQRHASLAPLASRTQASRNWRQNAAVLNGTFARFRIFGANTEMSANDCAQSPLRLS